ncbi:MAG: SDR family NAD(P)-dependent oxidoreductase [Caulobacteraceae bacterium]
MENVEGKTAFITGGASGMGLGMARVFAANGMKVVIADIRQEALDEAMAEFKDTNLAVHPVRLDVSDREAYARAADEAEAVFGKIHVLCNNAGIGVTGPIKNATYDDWDWLKSVMLDGVINGVQTILPRIRAHGEGGHIVNTASMSGAFASGDAGIYITLKYAVVGMAEALRWELTDENIGVSAFLPGGVKTNIFVNHKLRPEGMTTGYAAEDARREAMYEMMKNSPAGGPLDDIMMDIDEVGRRVLRGIRRNDLFIITHPEFREGIEARNAALIRAIPDEPLNQARLAMLRQAGTLLNQPIYATQTTPKGKPNDRGEDTA